MKFILQAGYAAYSAALLSLQETAEDARAFLDAAFPSQDGPWVLEYEHYDEHPFFACTGVRAEVPVKLRFNIGDRWWEPEKIGQKRVEGACNTPGERRAGVILRASPSIGVVMRSIDRYIARLKKVDAS